MITAADPRPDRENPTVPSLNAFRLSDFSQGPVTWRAGHADVPKNMPLGASAGAELSRFNTAHHLRHSSPLAGAFVSSLPCHHPDPGEAPVCPTTSVPCAPGARAGQRAVTVFRHLQHLSWCASDRKAQLHVNVN